MTYYDTVNPSIVVISVGSKGYKRYTHPHPDVFEVLKKRPNIHLLCTQATKIRASSMLWFKEELYVICS